MWKKIMFDQSSFWFIDLCMYLHTLYSQDVNNYSIQSWHLSDLKKNFLLLFSSLDFSLKKTPTNIRFTERKIKLVLFLI